MDPESMPWRAIDVASTTVPIAPGKTAVGPTKRPISTGTLAALGAAVLVVVAAFALAFGSSGSGGVGLIGGEPLGVVASGSSGTASDGGGGTADAVVVEIVGAVVRPGVYRLPRGARVDDLLAAAGGFGPRVDTERAGQALNRAAILIDGAQIRVPSRDDVDPGGGPGSPAGGGAGASAGSALVELNSATTAELEALPGIGPVTASKIITSREEARFVAVGDLRTRKLLGEKTFDGLKDLITVR